MQITPSQICRFGSARAGGGGHHGERVLRGSTDATSTGKRPPAAGEDLRRSPREPRRQQPRRQALGWAAGAVVRCCARDALNGRCGSSQSPCWDCIVLSCVRILADPIATWRRRSLCLNCLMWCAGSCEDPGWAARGMVGGEEESLRLATLLHQMKSLQKKSRAATHAKWSNKQAFLLAASTAAVTTASCGLFMSPGLRSPELKGAFFCSWPQHH